MKIGLTPGFVVLLAAFMASFGKGFFAPFAARWNPLKSFSSSSSHSAASSTSRTSAASSEGSIQPLGALVGERIIPSSAKQVHVIVLVHGYLGSPLELSYLKQTMEDQADLYHLEHPEAFFYVHSATSNDGRTSDGIAAGGSRLADEVNGLIQDLAQQGDRLENLQEITLSFVGNSLGGLYSRYALSEIDSLQHSSNDKPPTVHGVPIQHKIFCTTATPHLGVSEHTYLPLPRPAEYLFAYAMQPTGLDLFRYTDVIEQLATEPRFVEPLKQFEKRIAFANAYQTDFQVPTKTAAFLSGTDSTHRTISMPDDRSFVSLAVETPKQEDHLISSSRLASISTPASSDQLARRLDALGWTKVLCDVREHLPSVSVPFLQEPPPHVDKPEYSSQEILDSFSGHRNRWHAPFGHTVLVANSKNDFYARVNAAGKPIMQTLAHDLIHEIVGEDAATSSQSTTQEKDESAMYSTSTNQQR